MKPISKLTDRILNNFSKNDIITARRKFRTAKRIQCIGKGYSRNGWTQFDYYALDSKGNSYYLSFFSSYYSYKKRACWITGWGFDRTLEGMLDIGYSLGFDFHEIKQNKLLFR